MKIMPKGKRILSLVMAILMVFSILPYQTIAVEGETEESVIGRNVIFNTEYPALWTDKTNSYTKTYGDANKLPKVMVIVDEYQFSASIKLYQLVAAEGYTWPENYPVEGFTGNYWVESTKVTFVELCDKCGGINCEKVHVFCPYCDVYDCKLEHNDPYQPYVAPVIPENPTLTPGADVSVVDEYGNPVTDCFVVEEGQKYSLSAWPELGGEVTYQWQVCYNNAQMLWIDIYGQTGKGILASATMLRSLVDAQNMTYLRCVTTNGSETMTSEPIAIFLEEAAAQEPAMAYSARSYAANSSDEPVQPADDEVKYAVTVKYVMKVAGVEAPNPWVVHLAPGANYVVDLAPPAEKGFYPGDAAENRIDRITQTITNIQAPVDIVVYYWPDFVDFEVHHYKQRVGEDKYDLVATDIIEDMKTGQAIGDALAKTDKDFLDGFDILPYDTTITVAADGSTVVNIYYDRQYYMIAIDLNGGYGAEPIYARYETPINIPDPKRTGYTFAGWKNEKSGQIENIVETMPIIPEEDNFRITYQAQWTKANTSFTVAFWYEDANPEQDGTYHYTFVGSVQLDGKTDNTVSGSTYAKLNDPDNAEHFDGFNSTYAQHFTTLNADKTDKNVIIKADGSTVVNVYFFRNTYELTYYKWKCIHTHTNACCDLQHTSHSDSCCSISYHVTHTTGCVTNELKKNTTYIPESALDDAVPNRYNGVWIAYKYLGQTRYYVWFDGDWYRTANGNNGKDALNWNCCRENLGQYTHDHTSGCDCTRYHDHSAGLLSTCNSSGCTHTASWRCDPDYTNMDHWEPVHSSYQKYGADVSAIHKTMEDKTTGYRWCDMYFGGEFHSGEQYGDGGAMGTLTSMPGGKTIFFQGAYNSNSTLFEMQYWLETYDGDVSGTRYYDGRWFKKHGEPFYTRMSFVAWNGDYVQGLPAGYEILDCTFGSSADSGGVNDPYSKKLSTVVNSDGTTLRSYDKYNNYYYVREKFKLVYFNGSEPVAETTLMYEQPLTTDHDIRILTSADSPYGAGYTFGGWYLDPECTVPVDWNNTRMPDGGNTGDIGLAVYAKWLPIKHTVKVYLTKEDMLEGELSEDYGPYEINHGDTFANAYQGQTVPIPDNGGLNFIGWFYEEDGKEVAYDFSMPVYRDMNLYAKWNSNVVTYGTIYYEDTNGNELARPVRVTGTVGDTKTYSAKPTTELGDGKTLYFPDVTSHSIKFAANPDQNTFTFVYTALPEVSYTIKFVDKNDPTHELFPAVTGTASTSSVVYDAQAAGKTKDKYYLDKNRKEFALSSDPEHNVFYFYYTYDPGKATVQVEHYIENLDGKYEFHSEGQTAVLELETLVKATDYMATINGFTYSYATFNDVTGTQQELQGGLILKLYYSRNSYDYTFKFVYSENGVQKEFPDSRVTGTAKYRASIPQTAKTFPGYKADSGAKSIIVDYNEANNTYTFYYSEEDVKIYYSLGAVKGGTISSTSETVSAITGVPVGSTAVAYDNGKYIFTGWYSDYKCETPVSANATFQPEKADGIHVSKTYYAGFKEVKATVNYAVIMPSGAPNATLTVNSELVDIVTGIATGSAVDTIPNGYEFAGWYDANDNRITTSLSFTPVRPGEWEQTQTYYAKFQKGKFTITWVDGFGNTIDSKTLEYGDTVTGIGDPAKEGHTFTGWDTELPATMPAENIVITAQWSVNSYTVTWIVDGVETTETYKYGDTITAPSPEKKGYIFDGWDGAVPESMPAQNLTFTATWNTTISATISNGTIKATWEDQSLTLPFVPETRVPVGAGAGATLIFTPADGYRITRVTINGVAQDPSTFTDDQYIYTVPAEGITGPLNIVVITELDTTTLTVKVTGCADPTQAFIFRVTSAEDGVDLRVTVIGNGSVTITGVTTGKSYTVTMENWSWRYGSEAAETKTVDVVSANNTFDFDVDLNNMFWLDGSSYTVN